MKLSHERFNQDMVDIEGYNLYECGNFLTNGEFIVDKRCVNINNCTVEDLSIRNQQEIYKSVDNKKLQKIINDDNYITTIYDQDLYNLVLLATDNCEVVIQKHYWDIFAECTDIFYYKNMVYFFLDLPKLDEDDEDEIMFVGALMRCKAYEQQIANIKAINEFYDNLPYWKQGKLV